VTDFPVSPKLISRLSRRRLLQAAGGLGIAVGALPLFRPLPAHAQGEAPRRGGTLRVAAPPATTIDPVKLDSGGGIAVVQQPGEYLVWPMPDLSLRPMLATEWRPEDDGRSWVFAIRRDVRFHDGREMTAKDVVATFRRLVDPKNASPAAAQIPFLKPEGITAIDSHTVRFELERPIGSFPHYTHTYNAVILPEDYDGDFARKPIGTGPFKMTAYRPQEGASFVRNEDYWDRGRPHLDAVEIALYETQQPQILALQGGQAHVIHKISYIEAQALFQDAKVKILDTETSEHRQLCMRVDRKPFDDKRVRQAVALCFNRPAMVQGLLGGLASVGNDHAVAPIYPESSDIGQRVVDIAKAKALLAEAGYPKGFEIDLHTAQYLELPQYAVLAQQMLAAAGIKANLKVEPLNAYYDHWTEVSFGLTDWAARPVASQILGSAFRSTSEWNAAHWKNAQFDALLDRFEAEPSLEKRQAISREIETLMHDDVPAVIAYFTKSLRAVRQDVRGVGASMVSYLDLRDAWLAA